MRFINLIFEIFNPSVSKEYRNFKKHHTSALLNWLYGGFKSRRDLVPPNERASFKDYDNEFDSIDKITSEGNESKNIDKMSYTQKKYIIKHKQQIINLYTIFEKTFNIHNDVKKLSKAYPWGFNAVAIKYGNFRISYVFLGTEYRLPEELSSSAKIQDYIKYYLNQDYIKNFHGFEYGNIDALNYEQCKVIFDHIDELKTENYYLDILVKETHNELLRKEEELKQYYELIESQYSGRKLKIVDIRKFDIEEMAAVSKTEVVSDGIGLSCCFFMKSGGQTYIPMSKASKLLVGDTLWLHKARILTFRINDNGMTFNRIIEID